MSMTGTVNPVKLREKRNLFDFLQVSLAELPAEFAPGPCDRRLLRVYRTSSKDQIARYIFL
jgi:hypothetical protein